MAVFEKSKYKYDIIASSSRASGVELGEKGPFDVTQYLNCRQSSVGVDVYVPEEVRGIVMLEPVRNLKLKIGGGDEVVINCAAGTVCIIPTDQAIAITWPQPVCVLEVKLKDLYNFNSKFTYDVSNCKKVSIFTSRKCLQIGRIISESLEKYDAIDIDFVKSLYNVIYNLIVKGYCLSQDAPASNSGLSAYACRQIENHLKENFRDPISVADMANYLGMSSGHFASCFRESFGETPHQYLLGLRLDDAEKRLKETNLAISEIAAALNFSSQSHLTTALKKYRQLTPGEIRRRSSFNRRPR
ncbi:AraC family transcriptional regulator [Brucella gallinifaecis]|uniref:helix-turn-helix domain-containing protein n=1 Tax=Brucella gallinifaecis TaxID=215590 RepID=UPI00235ECD32|nr:AraC family transcriptional regulator [Brucella gallinifaecis]